MKKIIKKYKVKMFLLASMFYCNLTVTHADEPSFNKEKAKQVAQGWLTPLMDYALWIIPAAGACRIAYAGIMWLQKDEQEREQNPFHRTFMTYFKWTMIIELIPLIFKIFGLVTDI